ncbi:unnamed protein product [Rotaria sordida]|uniref:Uncharacterized protein n=1 Tax=Rotaria sordida TaxID=392033 RepID=A0A814R6P1_9BILA|nr:unnamed protein product [Rotaria sordida]CAF1129805.1 unnamed protein product [Rotaria sordida]
MNLNAEGQLEYEKNLQKSFISIYQIIEETKKHLNNELKNYLQKFSTLNIHINENIELLDNFLSSSKFFILIDIITSSDLKTYTKLLPSLLKLIRTFNSISSSLIFNIYEALRRISPDETILQLTNIFLLVDRELCIIKNQTTRRSECDSSAQVLVS